MTQEARFFDSQSGDRIYGASDWADIFRRFVTNGYVADDEEELLVTNAIGDRDIRVGLGAAWVEGRNFEIHTDGEIITLSAAGTGDRWDRVVVRMDTSERNVYLAVLQGAEGGARPALTRTDTRYELSLAAIMRPGGSTVVQDGDIRDERNDDTLCGVAQGHDVVVRSEPMTTADRDALSGDDLYLGRLIMNTDSERIEVWNGTTWNVAFINQVEFYTTTERDAISGTSLYSGLVVFNTDTDRLEMWDGSSWVEASVPPVEFAASETERDSVPTYQGRLVYRTDLTAFEVWNEDAGTSGEWQMADPKAHDHDSSYSALGHVHDTRYVNAAGVLSVGEIERLLQRVDDRRSVLSYNTDGDLTQVQDQSSDGATTVKTTDLSYDADGNLTSTTETVGGRTITTTLNYDADGNLTSTTRSVA